MQKLAEITREVRDGSLKVQPMMNEYRKGLRLKNYKQSSKGMDVVSNRSMISRIENDRYFSSFLLNVKQDIGDKIILGLGVVTEYTKVNDPSDGSPRSAYDVLFNKVVDCDAKVQLESTVLDDLGFNRSVRDGNGYAWMVFQVKGKWITSENWSII